MSLSFTEALGIAARCWGLEKTSGRLMDMELAQAFATVLVEISAGRPDPNKVKEPAPPEPEIRGKEFPGFEGYAGEGVHVLKTALGPFGSLHLGTKTFEWRKNDRDFKIGDVLVLREWEQGMSSLSDDGRYTGQVLFFEVTYVLKDSFNVPEGFCVMSVKPWKGSVPPPIGGMISERVHFGTDNGTY